MAKNTGKNDDFQRIAAPRAAAEAEILSNSLLGDHDFVGIAKAWPTLAATVRSTIMMIVASATIAATATSEAIDRPKAKPAKSKRKPPKRAG